MPESTRHRLAFERYWRLGANRSIERLQRALSETGAAPALRTLYEWSRRYHWQDRILDLEREARLAEDEARIAALKEMAERHSKEALLLQRKGTEWLIGLSPQDVSADAAIRAVSEGIRLERLVQGEPTQRTDVQRTTRLEGLTDDELARLTDFMGRNLGRDPEPYSS